MKKPPFNESKFFVAFFKKKKKNKKKCKISENNSQVMQLLDSLSDIQTGDKNTDFKIND